MSLTNEQKYCLKLTLHHRLQELRNCGQNLEINGVETPLTNVVNLFTKTGTIVKYDKSLGFNAFSTTNSYVVIGYFLCMPKCVADIGHTKYL